jgi:hypothetical protein
MLQESMLMELIPYPVKWKLHQAVRLVLAKSLSDV